MSNIYIEWQTIVCYYGFVGCGKKKGALFLTDFRGLKIANFF